MSATPRNHRCAWCRRPMDRAGICPKCAEIIRASSTKKTKSAARREAGAAEKELTLCKQ